MSLTPIPPKVKEILSQHMPTRKRSVCLYEADRVTIDGGSWNGGSRNAWAHVNPQTGESIPLPKCRGFLEAGPEPTIDLSDGSIVLCGGVTMGKPSTVAVYGQKAALDQLL